jgi:hypothetical protein
MLSLQLTPVQISKIGCPQIINISDQLPVNPAHTWPELTGLRNINDITRIFLHHDAYPKKNTVKYDDLQMAKIIANDHIKKTKDEPKGEPGIAYHGMVRSGQGYQVNDILNKTYGVASNNANSIHIMVCGDYVNFDTLTDPDRLALYGLIIAVIGVLPNFKDIKAHKELTATSCPGYDPNKVREDINKLQLALAFSETWAERKAKCGRINSQINYMDGLIAAGEADGNAIWALHWKEMVYKIMENQKLL